MAGDDIRQTISGQCQDTHFLGNHLSLGVHATPYSALDFRLENVSKMYNKHWSVAESNDTENQTLCLS
jgi:hypothetical protein